MLLLVVLASARDSFGQSVCPQETGDLQFLSSSPGIRNHMNRQVVAPDPMFPQSYQTILNKQEFIIHNTVTQLVQYSLYTLPTMSTIYDKPGAGWDRIS